MTDEISMLRVLNEETVLAGFPGGDREQTLANVRALRTKCAKLERAMYDVIQQRHDATRTLPQRADEMVRLAREALRSEQP